MKNQKEGISLHNVGVFLFDNVELLDFAGPVEVFSVTSELNDYQLFKVFTVSENGGEIKTVHDLKVMTDYNFCNHPPIDILVIPGGVGTRAEVKNCSALDWIAKQSAGASITMSVCSGAVLLGALGLLDNLEATTHHEVIELLKDAAPHAIINLNKRYIDNGKIMTSGGISAGIDLSLYVVKKLHGEAIANKTMRYMEYGNWRDV